MKRFISILLILTLCIATVFAYEDDEEYDDGYVYEQNGAGDQFIKLDLMAMFPLNFNKQIYVGGIANFGYYKFISSNIALGGSGAISYNLTIGEKPLITVPFTLDVYYQPYIDKFEFPLSLGIGFYSTTCQSLTYFPGLAVKATAGAYYRFVEAWSLGVVTIAYWLPQWMENPKQNVQGLFATAGIGVRYHF